MGPRLNKALLYPEYATLAQANNHEDSPLGRVSYQTGYADDPTRDYAPTRVFYDGNAYDRTPAITHKGWIEVHPAAEDISLRIYIRNVTESGFQEVKSFTGGINGAIPNEVRFMDAPGDLQGPIRIPISNFLKVYNDFHIGDGDLILFELYQRSTGRVERCLFRYRAFGFNGEFSYHVLFRVPVPGVQPSSEIDVGSPYFTLSYGLNYRFRTEQPLPKWVSDRVSILFSLGVGSTDLYQSGVPLSDQFRGAFNALILGTGVEVMDFVSLNLLFNLYTPTGDEVSAPWALAVGFDASQFTRFARNLGSRLFSSNRLRPMEPTDPQGVYDSD